MKRVISLFLMITMLFALSGVSFSEDNLSLSLNGESMSFSTGSPYVKDGYTMVPIRELAEKVGLTVSWESPKIVLKNDMCDVEFQYNSTEVTVNGEKKQSPATIDIKDGVSYAPLRFICESVGATVGYDAEKSAVTINFAQKNDTLGFNEKLNSEMPTDKNYMFSPLSIKMALAMAANGANGTTKQEILDTTGISNLEKFNKSAKNLLDLYNNNEDIDLKIANSIWLNNDYYKGADFSSKYQSTIEKYFDGEVQKVDAASAVKKINSWVAEKTNQKIKEIIKDNDFLAALINATYFKAKWVIPFEKSDTKKDTFTDKNGKESQVDFMNLTDNFDYCENDGVPMVRMPYKNCNISMYIALTDDRSINLEDGIKDMTNTKVALHIPKFKTEYSTSLKDVLPKLGIKTTFDVDKADFKSMFTKIPDGDNVYFSEVLHKSYIDVNEEGTEAAAVTVITMCGSGAPAPEKIIAFNADKPFTYFIRDDDSGEILFMGEYAFAN